MHRIERGLGPRQKGLPRPVKIFVSIVTLGLGLYCHAAASPRTGTDQPESGRHRAVTIYDLARIADVDALALSHDGRQMAFALRKPDPKANRYDIRWIIASMDGRRRLEVGDGGDIRLIQGPDGNMSGDVGVSAARWSAGDEWFAFLRLSDGLSSLWVANGLTGETRRVSGNGQVVRDFYWVGGDRLVYEVVKYPEETGRGNEQGYQADDFRTYSDLVFPGRPIFFGDRRFEIWTVRVSGAERRVAAPSEAREFADLAVANRLRSIAGLEQTATLATPSASIGSLQVRFEQPRVGADATYPLVGLVADKGRGSRPRSCDHPACKGPSFAFNKVWMAPSGKEVIFWRRWGSNLSEDAIFAWSIASGKMRKVRSDPAEALDQCEYDGGLPGKLICVREARLEPPAIVAIDLGSGRERVLFDANPAFRTLSRPRIERIEWPLPQAAIELGYEAIGHGYVIYPVGFDVTQKYPVIICPYRSRGFIRGDGGDEQPMLAYAAAGFIVLNSEFPVPWGADTRSSEARQRASLWANDSFAHLHILAESTFAALDLLEERGFVDRNRVGIGGVSQAAAEPSLMLQIADRFSAVSLGSPGNSQLGSYMVPGRLGPDGRRTVAGSADKTDDFWRPVDLSYHAGSIEAPILFNLADSELVFNFRLFRQLEYADKPYDLYVFSNETHFKWQPAHRLAIYSRNLDWFRFWLQDYSDPDPQKASQYERWEKLKRLQCVRAEQGSSKAPVNRAICHHR